ncbi:family 43 glycosylhydrolase, partial [Streptomyces scabiei]
RGSGLAHPEGPHLYRRGEWWYLLTAEGGTERGHAVCVARSRAVDGPFEAAPANPIFSRRSTGFPVQNTGHADLVERPDGSWAMVYLGVRPRGFTPGF